jgi:hypothetical protein
LCSASYYLHGRNRKRAVNRVTPHSGNHPEKEFETSPDLKQFLRFQPHNQRRTVLEESERKIRKRLTKMATTISQAVLEGASLIQAFVAALEALQITSLIYQPWGVYNFM